MIETLGGIVSEVVFERKLCRCDQPAYFVHIEVGAHSAAICGRVVDLLYNPRVIPARESFPWKDVNSAQALRIRNSTAALAFPASPSSHDRLISLIRTIVAQGPRKSVANIRLPGELGTQDPNPGARLFTGPSHEGTTIERGY